MSSILIVDDEKSIRITVSEFLKEVGYKVEIAKDAKEALQLLKIHDFDVVVSDIVLPHFTGVELLKSIKENSPNIQVILMTGEPNLESASEAVRSGAFDYLTKPITKEKIIIIVSQAIKVKEIDDERRRLEIENKEYQKQLEKLVEESTKSLIESEEQSHAILEAIPDMIFIINREHLFNFYHVSEASALYAKPEDFIGKKVEDILPPDLARVIIENVDKVLNSRRANKFEYSLEIENQLRYFESHMVQKCKDEVLTVVREITESKEAEERLKILFESAPDAYFICDLKGDFIDGNKATEKMIGYKKERLIGKNILKYKLLGIKELPRAGKSLTKSILGESSGPEEFALYRKDGSITQVEIVTHPVNIRDKKFILGIARDISKRKKTEEALRKSEDRFSRLSELTLEGILISKNGIVIDSNKAFQKIVGYSNEYMINKNIINLIVHKNSRKMVLDKIKNKGLIPYEIEIVRKDGKVIPVEVESREIDFVVDETVIKDVRVTTLRDITRRKENELEIQKLLNAVEQTPSSIVITDLDGNIEYVNKYFTEITGYSKKEVIGNNPRILKTEHLSSDIYNNLWETILSGKIWTGEFQNRKKSGEIFWESAIISPVKDDEGKTTHFVSVKEDITEKKAILEELIDSKKKAINADKMKSIFLAQMSHEIRTPINALVSMSSLLRYDFEESANEDQLMSFDIIDRAGGRIIRTIDLLLNLSEIQAGTYVTSPSKFDIIVDVISGVMAEYKKLAAKKNIKLNLNQNTNDTELVADSYTVNQIFTQLVDNAIKYTKEGEITIKTLRNELNKLVVEIKDSGIGIDETYLPNLFEPFSQEEMGYTRKFEGNGIGLALVNKYCEINNAKIEVESKKGIGSTFRVVF